MNGSPIDIPTADGMMDAYAARPDGEGPFPLVILFMDIWGLREELFGIARRVAAQGYYCVVPNLFYRHGKIRFERRNADGKMVSFDTLPDGLKIEIRKFGRGITRAMLHTDVAAILEFCRTQPVDPGPAGSVGFCLGGRMAILAAQEFPERFLATGSLHGTLLVTEAADSPHRLAQQMRGELYCGYAEHDKDATPEILAALAEVFERRADLVYRHNFHRGATHGYSLPDRDVHDHAAAETDWREVFAMLQRRLSRFRPSPAPA